MSSYDLPPSEEVLRQFLLGQLPPEELEVVGRFLQANPNVAFTLNALKDGDTLLDALRSAAATARPDSAEMVEVMARAEALFVANRIDENLTISSPTNTDDLDFAATVDSAEAGTNADLTAILAPAEQAGELGRLGEYRILRVLGRGGMGAVFEAEDAKLGRRVAIKVMLPALAANPNAKKRFLQEARTAAKMEHDHIVPIYQIGEFRGAPFLAMPLLVGETLDDRLRGCRPLATSDALQIGRQVAEGLGAAHAAGLIHRDIKPGNIWLEQHADGTFKRVRILDFGLARLTTERDAITHAGAILGTPAYMAPEQARGLGVDFRADLFSLGCVLYQMTTGQRPFKGNDTFAILTALATETPPPPSALNAEVPPAFSELIVQLLAKTPDARPQSACEVIAALDRVASEPLSNVASKDVTGMWVPVPSPRQPRRKWLVAAGVLFLALAAVAAYNGKTIVRVANNEGELIVEVDDPNVEVVVKGEGVEIRREENGKKRVFLVKAGKDGEVEVREPGSEVVLVMEKFKVTRAGKTEVSVTNEKLAAARRPKTDDPTSNVPGKDSARYAAEWILKQSHWCDVWIKTSEGTRTVSKLEDLPQGKFTLESASLTNLPLMKALPSEVLDGLRPIVTLQLGGEWITDEVIDQLRVVSGLATLSIQGAPLLTDKGLSHLPYVGRLKSVGIGQCPRLTDQGVSELTSIPTLRDVRVGNLLLTDKSATHLARLTQLTEIGLATSLVGDEGVKQLSALRKLETLYLRETRVTNAGLTHLKGTSLQWLDLNGTKVSDEGLEHLREISALRRLYLGDTTVTNDGLERLKNLPKLDTLDLGGSKVTDAGLAKLIDYSALTELGLQTSGKQITDSGLQHLAKCKRLSMIWLKKTAVTKAGVEKLAAALPNCRIEWDGPTIQPKAKSPNPPRYKNSLGMDFALVPKGKAWTGALAAARALNTEFNQPYDFYLGVYEVTQQEWTALMGSNPSHFSRLGGGKDDVAKIDAEELKRFPVENVSWNAAQLFLKALNEKEKETGWVYRLPTQKEWEYACRGGPSTTRDEIPFDYFFDKPTNDLTPNEANIFEKEKCLNRTSKVGSYRPNRLGLFDMHGNVYELCDDRVPDGGIAPRVLRGGAWSFGGGFSRAANPYRTGSATANPAHGLRVARVPISALEPNVPPVPKK